MAVDDEALSGLFADRYLIESEIGRGATAVVYRAVDTVEAHLVAVKVLRREIVDALGTERFLREMRHHGRLDHPRVLRLLDSGDCNGRLYVVLPFMEGGTLRERLRRERQLPFDEAIRISREITEALGAAHAAGLVHRDVKPENILFSGGHAFLGDFGIARALERAAGERTTSTGVVRGTPTYMSPEQASGESEYDGRSDIYSLGCVLYEMVAGVPTFVGPTTQSVIAQRLTRQPPPVVQYRDRTPEALDRLIHHALEMAPADRFQTAAELAEALDRAARLISGPHPRTVVTARRTQRRYRWAAALALVALGVAGGVRALRQPSADATVIPDGDPRRVAVLYFDALTPETLRPAFAEGITEDLIDRLGSVRVLRVTSPNGVRPFRGSRAPLDSIARVLKAGTMVAGSVARSGDHVRVVVRLIDAATGQQLDSQQLDERWSELFGLQDRLTEQVQFWLRRRLGEEISVRTTRAGTKSVQAWELVQQASADERRGSERALKRDDATFVLLFRADSLYERAAQLDPGWPLPVVRRGGIALRSLSFSATRPPDGVDAHRYAGMTSEGRRMAWARQAAALANQVLKAHPRDASALAVRGAAIATLGETGGVARDSILAMAERDLRESLDGRPDLASTWVALADLAMMRGKFADAEEAARRAVDADAFYESRRVVAVAFNASLFAEAFDGARQWCRMGLERYPGDPRFMECELRLLGSMGRTARDADSAWRLVGAIERRDSLHMLDATWGFRRLMVAAVLARGAQPDSARRVLDLVERRQSASAQEASELAACYVLTLVGDKAQAAKRLAALMHATPTSRLSLTRLPWFRSLRGEKIFDSLAARGG
ncbi:MAG: protein kinase domain-containing protein [Gemmatimonadaceae bacterium]